MLVQALLLRDQGRPLPAAELRAMPPLVGWLRFEPDVAGRLRGRGAQRCVLMPLQLGVDPLVQLFSARVRTIERRGIVIQGIEETRRRKQRIDFRQAMWCWPVTPADLGAAEVLDPLDAEDEARALADALRP
jgi:hypothetical protein